VSSARRRKDPGCGDSKKTGALDTCPKEQHRYAQTLRRNGVPITDKVSSQCRLNDIRIPVEVENKKNRFCTSKLSEFVWVPIMFHVSTVDTSGISKERPEARVATMKRDRSIDHPPVGRFGNLVSARRSRHWIPK
jgi:hypothetical protein